MSSKDLTLPPDDVLSEVGKVLPKATEEPETLKKGEPEKGFVSADFNKLKEKAPEVHDAMIRGIVTQILSTMRKSQERFKKALKGQH